MSASTAPLELVGQLVELGTAGRGVGDGSVQQRLGPDRVGVEEGVALGQQRPGPGPVGEHPDGSGDHRLDVLQPVGLLLRGGQERGGPGQVVVVVLARRGQREPLRDLDAAVSSVRWDSQLS